MPLRICMPVLQQEHPCRLPAQNIIFIILKKCFNNTRMYIQLTSLKCAERQAYIYKLSLLKKYVSDDMSNQLTT